MYFAYIYDMSLIESLNTTKLYKPDFDRAFDITLCIKLILILGFLRNYTPNFSGTDHQTIQFSPFIHIYIKYLDLSIRIPDLEY